MASELPPRDEVKALFDEIVAKLGTHISNTEIPIWDPTAADDVKIKNVQIMLANLQRLTTARSDAEYRKFFRRFRALAPDSWTSISDGLSPDGKSKLIQATSTRLAAQKEEERLAQARKQKRDEARAQREADKARKPAAAAAASSSSSASHPATDDRERALEKTKADQLAAAADAGRANVILEDEEQGKRLVEERRLQEDVRVLQEQIRLEEERLKEEANRMQQLMQGRAILLRNARQLQHDLGQVDVHDLKRQMFAEEKVALNRRIDVYITEIESFVDPSQIADLGGKIVPLRKTYEALVEAVKQERNEQNEREFQERKRQLLAEADVLSALFAELKALPKTGSSSINTRLRNLDAEFPAYRPLVQSLTADNHQMEDVLRDKALEFKTSFETLTRSINEVNDLLARLRRITQGLQDRLNQLQQQLELIDELNKPLLELQQQIRIYSGLLDQNESQNKQSLELIVPAIEQLVKKVDELDRQVGEKINELQKRLHDLRSDAPRDEERFYLTKGGWVVKKVASNFTVVGKIVADLPPNQKNYFIKPITADIRDEAKKIERYQFSKIEIRGGDLSMDEIRGRNLSPANAALFTEHKDDPLPKLPPPVVYGYYGFYKNSDVVGFAVADQDVPEAERSKLKFYAVGKHKIVGGKLQIQFDSNFDPRAWNIMTTQLPAPNMVVPERRRYRHEDYASDFPMPASELGKVPRINYFLCKGGIVLKFTEHEDGDKVELIARWSLNQGKTHIQISLIDDASKQKYRNLLDQRFDDEAIPLKQYRQHVGLIDLTDVASVRGLTIDAVTLTSHLNLSGNYYIYEGGHLVFHIGDGADEKKYVLGKCVLDGNKIKFNYANTLPTEDVITGKKHVQLVVKNADYADYSNVKGGVPNTVLDLLPEDEKKKELDKRLLKESRHYSPVPRPDVEFAAVGGGLPVEVSGPVSTDKTPGDLYLYNGGIVVEEKTIERNIAKKVVGRWELDGDHLKMKTVMPEEGERLQSLLDLSGPQAKKMKVVNSPVVDLSGAPETRHALNEIKNSKVGYYRFRADGSVWFCPAERVNEPSPGFFSSNNKKRKREWEYEFNLVGHWKLNDQHQPIITYTNNPDHKRYTKEDLGYFHLLTEDRLPRPLGHQFTIKDFKAGELAEAADQLKKYSADLNLDEREKTLSSDNKAWHTSLKRKKCSVFEDTYGASHLGRHTIMTPADQHGKSQTFWHDTKSNTIGIPPGAELDNHHMIRKYVELAGHFCKPKLDANAEPAKMAIRFNARVNKATQDAIIGAIEAAYPAIGKIEIARDEAHFKQLLSSDNSDSQSQPGSPRLSASNRP